MPASTQRGGHGNANRRVAGSQAAFIGSACLARQQVSWLADHSLAAPSHTDATTRIRKDPSTSLRIRIIVVILRVDGIASNAMASAARSPLTVTGSPGISTRFPIIPARAGHCCVVIIISALWVFVNADEKRAPPIRMTPHKVRCLSGRASWTGCRTPRRPAAQSP